MVRSLSISVFWIAFAAFVASGNSKETTAEDSQRQRHIRRKLENPQPQLRIIGGDNANEDRYPYYVALMRRGGSFVCGGALVAPDVVLTAAHCWSNDLEVALIGKFERRGSNQDEVEEREIEETYIHPQFDFDRRRFDQMLITLTSPSTFPYLKHVNMDGRAPAVGGSDITTIGLGATNIGGSLPNVLQEGTSRYVPNTECSSFRQQESQLINFEHLCVDSQTNAGGACYGDSGSPQLLRGATADDDILVGIVSWGVDCETGDFPTVGSRTSASNFIKSGTCELSSDPPSILCADPAAVPPVDPPAEVPTPEAPAPEDPVGAPEDGSCTHLLSPCLSDTECCSNRCHNGSCRTSPVNSRQSLAGNRGGAAGRANRPGAVPGN